MLTRALIVLLLVLNLGVALWWWWREPPSAPAAPPQPAGVPLLELPAVVREPRPAPIDLPEAAQAAASGEAREPLAATAGSGQCFAFGPFEQPPAPAQASAIAHGPVRLQPLPADAAPPRGWRVVIPPQPDAEAASALQQRLREAGFNDQLLVRNPPEAGSIALGSFGNRETALRHRERLAEAGFPAQLQPTGNEIRPALAFELRAGIEPDAARASLQVLRAQALDCATLR